MPYYDDDDDFIGGPFDDADEFGGLDEDDYLAAEIMAAGGPDLETGAPKWLKKVRKGMRKINPVQALWHKQVTLKKRKKAKKAMQKRLGVLAAQGNTASVVNPKIPTDISGARFLNAKDCMVQVSPIPVESRVPKLPAKQALFQAALEGPNTPIVTSGVKAAADLTIRIDPYSALDMAEFYNDALGVGSTPYFPGIEKLLRYCLIKVDIGLPGVGAAAGIPIAFRVFTYTYGVDPSNTQLGMLPWSDIGYHGIFGYMPGVGVTFPTQPTPWQPSPERSSRNSFDSGTIIITPNQISSAASLILFPWEISQGLTQPKLLALESRHEDLDYMAPDPMQPEIPIFVDPPFSGIWRNRGLALTCTSAPNSTSVAMTLLTPTHPEWKTLMGLLEK